MPLPAVWLWSAYLTFLCISFLMGKVGFTYSLNELTHSKYSTRVSCYYYLVLFFSWNLPLSEFIFIRLYIVYLSPYGRPHPPPPLQDVRSVRAGNLSCFVCCDISPVSRAEAGIYWALLKYIQLSEKPQSNQGSVESFSSYSASHTVDWNLFAGGATGHFKKRK